MKHRFIKILCTVLFLLPNNFSKASTGEFKIGIDVKTSKILSANKAVSDYFLFNSIGVGTVDPILLNKESEQLFDFKLIPLIVGWDIGYSYYFTPKIGLSINLNLFHGNIAILNLKDEKYKSIKSKTSGNQQKETKSKSVFKINVIGGGGDIRGKYDLFGSSLDFCDYGRNNFKGSISLGFKSNWLFSKQLVGLSFSQDEDDVKENNGVKVNGVLSSDRINIWQPGVVLGIDAVLPFNLGLGVDFTYFFRNVFCSDDDIKKKDNEYIKSNSVNASNLYSPNYNTYCGFLQLDVKLFYDFAPFINNHEVPDEIDIERW